MSKKSKKDKDRNKDYYQEQNPHQGYNQNMQNPHYNPNMNYNTNMQNPYYNQGYPQGYPQGYNQGYNQNYNQNPQSQNDLSTLMNLLNNIDANQLMGMLSQMNLNQGNQGGNMDQAYNLLNSLKPFMPAERINMVEQVLSNMNSQDKK